MKIGYYIHHTTLRAGGIFTYSIGILKLLLNSDEIESIVLIISADQKEYFESFSQNSKLKIVIVDRNKLFVKVRLALSYFLFDNYTIYGSYLDETKKLNYLKKLSLFLNPYRKIIKSKSIDLLHIPMQFSPIYGGNVPIVITMHDLQEFHYPEYFDASERLHRALNTKKAIEESDHIIVSFNHIKKDIIKYSNIDENKVSTCTPPFTEDWFLAKDFTSMEQIKDKYHIRDEFLLYPAATWRHKNHINLIKAISSLRNEGISIQLVCTGNKTKYYVSLKKKISELGLHDQIKFLGIIPEEDLIGLYKCASIVVIPTLYEAGSGPLYEAMRYSVPVICSDVTSLPDTMGNKKYIFNPNNINEIASLIKKMLQEKDFKSENLKNSVERLLSLSKVDYEQNFISVYKKLMSSE